MNTLENAINSTLLHDLPSGAIQLFTNLIAMYPTPRKTNNPITTFAILYLFSNQFETIGALDICCIVYAIRHIMRIAHSIKVYAIFFFVNSTVYFLPSSKYILSKKTSQSSIKKAIILATKSTLKKALYNNRFYLTPLGFKTVIGQKGSLNNMRTIEPAAINFC